MPKSSSGRGSVDFVPANYSGALYCTRSVSFTCANPYLGIEAAPGSYGTGEAVTRSIRRTDASEQLGAGEVVQVGRSVELEPPQCGDDDLASSGVSSIETCSMSRSSLDGTPVRAA